MTQSCPAAARRPSSLGGSPCTPDSRASRGASYPPSRSSCSPQVSPAAWARGLPRWSRRRTGARPAQAAVDIQEADGAQRFVPAGGTDLTLKIASGSENKEAAEAIAYAAGEAGVTVEMHYMGSLEIRSVLEAGGADYDAVWPASSMWISLGDTGHITPKRPEHLDHARGLRHRARPCRGARLGRRVRRHGVAHHGGDPRRGGGGRALLRHDLGHAVQQRRIRLPGVPDGALGLGRAPYRRRPRRCRAHRPRGGAALGRGPLVGLV